MRVAASSLFAEYAAPGLIELFVSRAADLDVELSVHNTRGFESLLSTRSVDVAIGPKPRQLPDNVTGKPFLNYQIVVVAGPRHPLAHLQARPTQLREQTWLLGPSAAGDDTVVRGMLRRFDVPEEHQRIFQSHAAALEETSHNKGISLALSFAVADDISNGRLVAISGPGVKGDGVWSTLTLPEHSLLPAAAELRASSPPPGRPVPCCAARAPTSAISALRSTSPSGADDVGSAGLHDCIHHVAQGL